MTRIGVSTGGGDAPGLNAVIRSVVLGGVRQGWEMVGIRQCWGGLLGDDEVVPLDRSSVRGIGHLGGTVLGTTNRRDPFRYPTDSGEVDRSDELVAEAARLGIDGVIAIGGEGTLGIALGLWRKGLPLVGVPKTIDNDVDSTDVTFGFDSAVAVAVDAIDRLHTTAESHDRVMVLEVMGRHAGFIALHAGLAGTADVVLLPEIPHDLEHVCDKVRSRDAAGRRFSIVVVAEGAADADQLAHQIEARIGKESRALVLGHLQRGGAPTARDRLIATQLGVAAVQAVAAGQWGTMVAIRGADTVTVPLEQAGARSVDAAGSLVRAARAIGISFGDAPADS